MARRSPPKPKSTRNLPPALAAYWAKRGVPGGTGGGKKKTSRRKKKR